MMNRLAMSSTEPFVNLLYQSDCVGFVMDARAPGSPGAGAAGPGSGPSCSQSSQQSQAASSQDAPVLPSPDSERLQQLKRAWRTRPMLVPLDKVARMYTNRETALLWLVNSSLTRFSSSINQY